MNLPILTGTLSSAWEVLLLFLIPIGGGIPGGVLLARARGFDWPIMMLLYLISDVILACLFEPILLLLIALGKKVAFVARVSAAFKKAMQKTTVHYGTAAGPFALIMIAFGADPMTGRAAAVAAGHGFLTGWMLAITGDMIYFTVLMISTLWLNSLIGDGTWTTLIILVLMMTVPIVVRKIRERR